MNSEILTKIKTLLGMESEEVSLSQMKLEDGLTIVESESFKEEDSISIITEDGKVPMPEGDYTLEDGRLLVVKEEGVIAEVKEKKEEKEEKEEKEVKEEVIEKEQKEEYMESEAATPKKIVETISKESFFAEIEKLKTENNNLIKQIEELKLNSVEKPTTETTTEENTEVTNEVELKEEVKPIVHNPENKSASTGFKYAQNRMETTLDRVMRKISEK